MTGKRYVAEGFAKIKYHGFYLGLKGLGIFFTGQLSGGTLQKYSYSYFHQNSACDKSPTFPLFISLVLVT